MDKPSLILVSSRPEDIKFFSSINFKPDCDFIPARTWEELVKLLSTLPNSVVLWDADHPDTRESEHPCNVNTVKDVLMKLINPMKVFAVTNKTANQYPELGASESLSLARPFQHNLLRRYSETAKTVYTPVIKAAFHEDSPLDLARYFPKDTKIQKIALKKAEHRKAAVEALQSFLIKTGIDPRLGAKVAQAADELLMNAIFDAARDKNDNQIRQLLDRKANFDLGKNENVELQTAATKDYVGICVTDSYGSLNKEVTLKFVNQDYHDQDYKIRKYGPGAGLGLYGIVQSGLSLLLVCKAKVRTDAMIFFPNTNSYKSFKEGFQFSACFSSLGSKLAQDDMV